MTTTNKGPLTFQTYWSCCQARFFMQIYLVPEVPAILISEVENLMLLLGIKIVVDNILDQRLYQN